MKLCWIVSQDWIIKENLTGPPHALSHWGGNIFQKRAISRVLKKNATTSVQLRFNWSTLLVQCLSPQNCIFWKCSMEVSREQGCLNFLTTDGLKPILNTVDNLINYLINDLAVVFINCRYANSSGTSPFSYRQPAGFRKWRRPIWNKVMFSQRAPPWLSPGKIFKYLGL